MKNRFVQVALGLALAIVAYLVAGQAGWLPWTPKLDVVVMQENDNGASLFGVMKPGLGKQHYLKAIENARSRQAPGKAQVRIEIYDSAGKAQEASKLTRDKVTGELAAHRLAGYWKDQTGESWELPKK